MKKLSSLFPVCMFFLIVSCSSPDQQQTNTPASYPNAHLLTDAEELNNLLDEGNILLIDARSGTGGDFVPGAVHFSARDELADPDHPISNFLIGPELFQQKMRELGLSRNDRVIIMDEGNSLLAARLFYALEYYGFSNASLLNGGMAAWLDADYPTTNEPATSETGNFTVDVQPAKFCDYETIVAASTDPDKIVFDVRSKGEYTGEVKRAEKSGHIPNAVNLEWSEVLEPDGIPYFLSADEIQERYTSAGLTPDKEIIPHCQSNVRGSHAYFTLRLMGYDSVRPYEASWTEYGNREESAVEQDM